MKIDDFILNRSYWSLILVVFSFAPINGVAENIAGKDQVQKILLSVVGMGVVFMIGVLSFQIATNKSKVTKYIILGLTAAIILTIGIFLS